MDLIHGTLASEVRKPSCKGEHSIQRANEQSVEPLSVPVPPDK